MLPHYRLLVKPEPGTYNVYIMSEQEQGKPGISRRDFLKLGFFSGVGLITPESMRSLVPYISHGDRDSNKVAITIDDGWYAEKVTGALEALEGTPASLFIVGSCLSRDREMYAQAIDNGFEIYNHTWDHSYLSDKNVDIKKQVLLWESAYAELNRGEFKNKLLRAPANEGVNNAALYTQLGNLDYRAIMGWTYASPGVFSGYSTEDVVDYIVPKMTGGDIILMHFTDADIGALPAIKQAAKEKGLELVGLTGLPGMPIYRKPKEQSTTVRQPRRRHIPR